MMSTNSTVKGPGWRWKTRQRSNGELQTIRRQKPEVFRQAVELAARQQTDKALAKLVELGAVTEGSTDDGQLYQQAAEAYLDATNRGKSALLVSPTWAEIESVTERVRETLKAKGVLGRIDETVTIFDSLSWTEAHRRSTAQFQPGQRIRFLRAAGAFAKGETLEVLGADAAAPGTLRLRIADGTDKSFNPSRHAAAFDVGVVRELKVAPGDWLLLQANLGKELINGERVQVREIQGGRIALADGRQLPAGYNTFTHGYAVTSHTSQSKTVDEVLVVASSRSFSAVNREQFYVSISRGRECVHVFTDDTDLLARRVTVSHERKAAVELQGLREELAKLGFLPPPSSTERARKMVPSLSSSPLPHLRDIRPMRRTRASRWAPLQRLVQVAVRVGQWLSGDVGVQGRSGQRQKESIHHGNRNHPSIHPGSVRGSRSVNY